jgi:DNA polymerase III subunit gamma/tau
MLAFKPASESATAPAAAAKPVTKSQPAPAEKPAPAAAEKPAAAAPGLAEWDSILPALGLSGMAHAFASNCSLASINGSKVKLLVAASHQPMLNAKLKERITEALSKHLGKDIQLDIETSTAALATPVKQQQQQQAKRLESATQSLMQDPKVRQFIEMYDATVEVSLV